MWSVAGECGLGPDDGGSHLRQTRPGRLPEAHGPLSPAGTEPRTASRADLRCECQPGGCQAPGLPDPTKDPSPTEGHGNRLRRGGGVIGQLYGLATQAWG